MKPTFNYILNDLALSSLIFRTVDSNEVASEQDKIDMKYQIELLQKENTNLKQALNEIREYAKKIKNFYWVEDDEPHYVSEDILQIIDKVLGDDKQ